MMEIGFAEALAQTVAWVRREPGAALLVAVGANLLTLMLALVALGRGVALGRRQRRLLSGASGGDIERLVLEHASGADALRAEVTRTGQASESNTAMLRHCFQRTGLVRYDALPGAGGEQSFSLALLDAAGNGVVISGLHGRHDMRVYAKPVAGGVSTFALSGEEREAIASARPGGLQEGTATRQPVGRVRR